MLRFSGKGIRLPLFFALLSFLSFSPSAIVYAADTLSEPSQQYAVDRLRPDGMTPEDFQKIQDDFAKETPGLYKPATTAVSYAVGDQIKFWTQSNSKWKQLTAECRVVTSEAYIFITLTDNYGNAVWSTGSNAGYITQTDIASIGAEFSTIYSKVRSVFGNEPSTGLNGESKVTILLLDIDDSYRSGSTSTYTGGYFYSVDISTADLYAQSKGVHSNERKILYIDTYPSIESSRTPNTNHTESGDNGIKNAYLTISHEFQHMVHYQYDKDESDWINEGCSELSSYLCGYGIRVPTNFCKNTTGNSLIDWSGNLIDYEQSALLFLYLYEKYGGVDTIKKIVADAKNSTDGIEDVLKGVTSNYLFSQVYTGWSVCNLIGGYSGVDLASYSFSKKKSVTAYPSQDSGTLPVWATQYIEFTGSQPLMLKYSSSNSYSAVAVTDSANTHDTFTVASSGVSFTNFGSSVTGLTLVASAFGKSDQYVCSAEATAAKIVYPSDTNISFTPGSTYTITWTGFSGSYVRIDLYTGSTFLSTIVASTENDGSYVWTVPAGQAERSDYVVKITNTSKTTESDLSDNSFSIGASMNVSANAVSNAATGTIISVPVTASQASNLYSCSLQVNYISSDLDLVNVTCDSGVLLEWRRTSVSTVAISIAKSAGFGSGTPTLCTLRFYVKKGTGSTTVSLNASSLFYRDSGTTLTASLQSGIVTIPSGTTITGGRGDVNGDSAYDVRDALYVLRMATLSSITIGSATTASPYTTALKYHADVSGDGSVLSNDATLILRYALGINSNLYPLSSAGKTAVTSPTLSLVDQQNTGSSTIRRIAVTLDGTSGIASGDFQIQYDPDKVTRATIIQSDLEGMNFECNEPSKGDIRVAMAGANGMESGKKTLFLMELETTGGNESVDVSIRSARLWNEQANEQTAAFENATLTSTATPHAFFLYQNSPNPFNASTVIRFTSTCASRIQLRVYDIRGAVVRTLLDEDRSAGLQSVSWDGRNDRGESVASGVYLFELRSMGTKLVKRMTLMK